MDMINDEVEYWSLALFNGEKCYAQRKIFWELLFNKQREEGGTYLILTESTMKIDWRLSSVVFKISTLTQNSAVGKC